jgi:adenine/guanine phosphoribosyltransferase-like PRPP-binding protein
MALRLHASYLEEAIYQPDVIVTRARARLADVQFDTVIGTGLSGALVVPMLARALDKHFAVVRKPDNSHSCERIEGTIGDHWLFVDDLISSGETFRRVREAIQQLVIERHGHHTEYVGTFLYSYGSQFREPGREGVRW